MILRGKVPKCKKCGSRRITGWHSKWDYSHIDEDGVPDFVGNYRTCKACGNTEWKRGPDEAGSDRYTVDNRA